MQRAIIVKCPKCGEEMVIELIIEKDTSKKSRYKVHWTVAP